MGAHRDVAGPIATHLLEVAADRGPECTTDDLSGAVYRSAETLALECWRRGYAAAAAAFEDEPTRPSARSQTLPAIDDEVTPTMAEILNHKARG